MKKFLVLVSMYASCMQGMQLQKVLSKTVQPFFKTHNEVVHPGKVFGDCIQQFDAHFLQKQDDLQTDIKNLSYKIHHAQLGLEIDRKCTTNKSSQISALVQLHKEIIAKRIKYKDRQIKNIQLHALGEMGVASILAALAFYANQELFGLAATTTVSSYNFIMASCGFMFHKDRKILQATKQGIEQILQQPVQEEEIQHQPVSAVVCERLQKGLLNDDHDITKELLREFREDLFLKENITLLGNY